MQYIGCWIKKKLITLKKGTFYSNKQLNYNIKYVIICNNGL